MTYDIGDQANLDVTFTDGDGELTDPTTVTLKVMDPSDNVTTYVYPDGDVDRISEGHFRFVLNLSAARTWYYRWEATGDVVAATEGVLHVHRSRF